MLNTFETLEIEKILEETLTYSKSELNQTRLLEVSPIDSFDLLDNELKMTDEALRLITSYGALPITNSFNLSSYIVMAKKGGILTALDLDHVASDAKNAEKIAKYFNKAPKVDFPLLKKLVEQLIDLSSIELAIRKVVLPSLEISDDASFELRRIRRKLSKLSQEIRQRANVLMDDNKTYLSDEAVTIKDGHFVLPVQNVFKSKVMGLVHGFSDTRQTVFIEPSELVELNNELIATESEEKDEIKRLLKELTLLLLDHEDDILNNNEIIARLDFLASKATYGINHDAIVAKLSKDHVVHLEAARHPLINKDVVVANDFHLDDKNRMIIISGPNAGGKTVAVKTLGILVYLNQLGFPLTTSKQAIIGHFKNVYVDIGDNQSLSENLSTFAAHIKTLSSIMRVVGKDDIVLLDELGTGTAPREGEALAISVADFLLQKGAVVLISSHFEGMKEYAFSHPGVQNAMMAFDEKELLPTYKLKLGMPGKSYGLVVAKTYNLNESIILNAKKLLDANDKSDISDVMEKLAVALSENERIKKELEDKERSLQAKIKSIENREAQLEEKKDKLLEDVDEEKRHLVEKAKLAVNEALSAIRKDDVKEHELIDAKRKLKHILESDEEKLTIKPVFNETLSVGSYVRVIDLGLVGKVNEIKGKKVFLTTSDGLSASVKIDQLEVIEAPKEIKPYKEVNTVISEFKNVSTELNVIGLHIDEALPQVERYINDAYIRHLKQVRIIHGMGTGRLRAAIRDYLKSVKFVAEYKYAENNDGGEGATIVIFK